MSTVNMQFGYQTVAALSKLIDGDVKMDPMFSAMVKSMEHAVQTLAEQAEREQAQDMEEAMGYIREKFEFHSGEFQESLEYAKENFHRFSKASKDYQEQTALSTVKFLNALSLISDVVVNVALTDPMQIPDDPTLEVINIYFDQIKVRPDFHKTFLEPMGMRVEMRPIFADTDTAEEFSNIRQPVLIIERDGEELAFTVAPSHLYLPDWYFLFISFYRKADELMEDARIAQEEMGTSSVEQQLEKEERTKKQNS